MSDALRTLDWQPLGLTLQLAAVTTLLLLLLCVPLAAWLALRRPRAAPLFEAVLALPLVLPPTVIGFYLLWALSPAAPLGGMIERALGLRLVFSFEGLVLGSVVFSLPFMLQPLIAAFRQVPLPLIEMARTLGKSDLALLRHVLLPQSRHGLLAGAVLAFAHTVGEFGVVLMIGGSIAGETRVASIALYDEVEALNYAGAHAYALVLVLLSLVALVWVQRMQSRAGRA